MDGELNGGCDFVASLVASLVASPIGFGRLWKTGGDQAAFASRS